MPIESGGRELRNAAGNTNDIDLEPACLILLQAGIEHT
jgi:hypothetical protein